MVPVRLGPKREQVFIERPGAYKWKKFTVRLEAKEATRLINSRSQKIQDGLCKNPLGPENVQKKKCIKPAAVERKIHFRTNIYDSDYPLLSYTENGQIVISIFQIINLIIIKYVTVCAMIMVLPLEFPTIILFQYNEMATNGLQIIIIITFWWIFAQNTTRLFWSIIQLNVIILNKMCDHSHQT